MKRPNWPGLERRVSRHGLTCWYVRIGKTVRHRLRAEPASPEFRAEYEAAYSKLLHGEQVKPEPKRGSPGTLFWLWAQYCKSSDWSSLKLSTRRQRENIMKHVLETAGHAPIEKITKQQLMKGREERRETPSAANNFLATVRALFEWAVEADLLKTNPCDGVKLVKRPKSKGFPEWDDEDEAKFISRWPLGTRQYLAYMVHACTGLRRGDAVRLGRQHFKKDGKIHLTAEKNGAELTIPVHAKLVEAIEACPPNGLNVLETSKGKPWGKESYGNEFLEWSKAASIAELDTGRTKNSHGIRKLAATRVAEAGASELEMMALFGWTDPKMARRYTMSANKNRLASQAAARVGEAGAVVDLFSIDDGSRNGR